MQSIRQLRDRAGQLDPVFIIIESVQATGKDVVQLNKDQLYDGLNAEDQIIGEVRGGIFGYKSADYAFEKYARNPNPGLGNPDLFFNGAFYAGIIINIVGRRWSIYSIDSKNDNLFQKYPAIFGLGPVAQRRYIKESLQPALNQKRIEKLGL